MNLQKVKKILVSFLASGVLTLTVSLLADALVVFLEMRMTPLMFAGAVGGLTLVFALWPRFSNSRKLGTAAVILAVGVVLTALGFGVWSAFVKNAPYMDVDTGKEKLYAGRAVMVIVPHQDDESNILAGVLEEFANYGSAVTVVYTTNGDMDVPAELRMEDALNYCASVGIPGENVIFLGYGDKWQDPQPDIYNAQPEEVLISNFGASQTYGSENKTPWREGRAYTRRNICEDLRSVILAQIPELIFCIDMDDHIGHISTSLLFEEVMGDILKEMPQYQPLVMKGFAYGTAWFAQNDYFRINMLATQNLFGAPYYQSPAVYEWENRIRFPVDAAILSRSAVHSEGYEKLKLFASQTAAVESAPLIINGDKVFWQRRTDSLCADADISVSSGEPTYLNDFKLLDNGDLKNQSTFYDGVWIPAEDDMEKTVICTLEKPSDIYEIVLYDHPSYEADVLDARITFDDGSAVSTGMLYTGGAATRITVKKQNVSSFAVTLVETEGENAGLSEIEAFSSSAQGDLAFVKLMDGEGNFAYDYCISSGSEAVFQVYRQGDVPSLEQGNYRISSSNEAVLAEIAGENVHVICPVGEEAVITLFCEDAEVSDSVYIRNPGKMKTGFLRLGQQIENFGRFNYKRLMSYWFIVRVAAKLGMNI